MTSPPRDDAVARLLGHDAFVRGLAHQLVRDPHAADDAAQATWLAALHRGPGGDDDGRVRGFLATVLRRIVGRHVRSERREVARRQRLARDAVVPSPDEILAREAQRAAIVRHVLALEPGQRDVVLLRFFEHLPPRTIAQRLVLPVETVRTRLKRALAKLRERLDQQPGGRAAWVVLLKPFARAPVALPWSALVSYAFAGGFGMSLQKALAVVAAIAVLALGWWTLVPAAPTIAPLGNEPNAPQARGDVPVQATPGEGAAAAATAASARRSAAPAGDAPTTGAMTVRVVRGADATPVPDCIVQITTGADAVFDQRRQRTGSDGSTTFADLPSRRLSAQVFPSISAFSDAVLVEPGRTVEATIRLERVMDLDGIVVDASGRAIADAEVLLADWTGNDTEVVARTDANGTFRLRGIATHCHIGARAKAHAASPLRQLAAANDAKLDVRIVLDAPAAEVLGRVVDAAGRAVAGAIVRCGSLQQENARLPDGGIAMGWRPEVTTSAADGAFALRHLPAGTHTLAVRAKGLAPGTQTIQVAAGQPLAITVVLADGVTVQGRAADAAGAAVRADIEIGAWDELGHRRVRAAADGTFRIEGLAAGALAVRASAEGLAEVQATIDGTPGATVTWNPVLTRGRLQRGRVVDADGKAVAAASITVRLANGEPGSYWAFERSDAEGRFQLVGCPERALRIQVARTGTFPELVLPRLAPGDDELRLELPRGEPIHIVGTVRGPDGSVLPSVALSPFHALADNAPVEAADAATGAFRLGPYPPGEYSLQLTAAGFPDLRIERRAVASGETWDLGELRFANGGDLVVTLVAENAAVAGARLAIHTLAGRWLAELPCPHGSGRSGLLAPGDYTLRIAGDGTAALVQPFTIRGGATTRLDVPLTRGATVTLTAHAPTATPDGGIVAFRVSRADGTVLAEPAAAITGGIATVTLGLGEGSYEVHATTDTLAGITHLAVAAGAAAAAARCELRTR